MQLWQYTFIYKVLRKQNIQKLWAVILWQAKLSEKIIFLGYKIFPLCYLHLNVDAPTHKLPNSMRTGVVPHRFSKLVCFVLGSGQDILRNNGKFSLEVSDRNILEPLRKKQCIEFWGSGSVGQVFLVHTSGQHRKSLCI